MSGLMIQSAVINMKDIDDIRLSLMSLADSDCDFNGENGDLCDLAEAGGFESNADYFASSVVEKLKKKGNFNQDDIQTAIDDFITAWLEHDSYYGEYNFTTEAVGDSLVVTVAAVTEG